MPTRTTEEELRERLLDLENRRSEEERRRLETESILAGLQILSNEGTSNLFECLLTTLQPAFGFDAAIVIKSSALDDIWEPIHATHDHLSVIKWTPGSFFKRVMTGSAAATFDASMISEWRKQPDDIRQQYTSLLAIPLSFDHTNPTVLIFLSRQPHAFTQQHVNLANRFWPLANTALSTTSLKRKNAQLASAVDMAMDGISIIDNEGIFTYMNDAHASMFGYERGTDLVGKHWSVLYNEKEGSRIAEKAVAEVFRTGHWRGEALALDREGNLFDQEFTLNVLKDDNLLCITRDMSARKKMEEDLRLNAMHLEEAVENLDVALVEANAANDAKTSFMANMSHELRTPLNIIIGFSQIMKDEMFGPLGNEKNKEYIGDILYSANHLLLLINDVLDISKIEAGRMNMREEKLDIGKLVKECMATIHSHPNSNGLQLQTSIIPDSTEIIGDRRMLRQIVFNLLSNAIKYTNKGGVNVSVHKNRENDIIISVSDTGIGICKKDQEKIFEPFTRSDDEYIRNFEGIGLGLTLSQELARLHDGRITLESAPGEGSTFEVILPKTRIIN